MARRQAEMRPPVEDSDTADGFPSRHQARGDALRQAGKQIWHGGRVAQGVLVSSRRRRKWTTGKDILAIRQ